MADHNGKAMSPWQRVALLDRALAGENRRVLEEEFGVHRATINRWVAKWDPRRKAAKEAEEVAPNTQPMHA